MKYHPKCLVICLLITLGSTQPGWSGCLDELLVDQLVGSSVTLRKSINGARVFYLNDGFGTYYHFKDNRSYLYGFSQSVTIEALEADVARRFDTPKCDRLKLVYKNDLLGSQEIVIASESNDPLPDSTLRRCLESMFVRDSLADEFTYYVRNIESGNIHSSMCDHLSGEEIEALVVLPDDYEGSLCGSCFHRPLLIPDITLELQIGKLAVNGYLIYNASVQDRTLEERIVAAGHRVLEAWPLPLRGYDYRFIVIDDGSVSAFAAPGGTVFFTQGLLETLESENELLAVMAHEISHVELRHGLRQYRSAKQAKAVAGIAAALIGAAVSSTSDDANAGMLAAGAVAIITDVFSEIALKGYSQKYEIEADQLASLFLSEHIGDTSGHFLGRVLRKLRYQKNEAPHADIRSAFRTHPPLAERLSSIQSGAIVKYDPPLIYRGYDKMHHLVAELKIMAYHWSTSVGPPRGGVSMKNPIIRTYRIACFADLQTTAYLGKPSKVKHFDVVNGEARFDNEQDTKLIPGQGAGIVFYYDSRKDFKITEDMQIKLKLRNVKTIEGPFRQ